jgi:hypothetical protein
MKLGLSGEPIPANLPYAEAINKACSVQNFWPLFAYAVAFRETIVSQENGSIKSASEYVSFDQGHGLFQLTSSWPDNWHDPETNCAYAIKYFLQPAVTFWSDPTGYNLSGLPMLRCVAAEFNCGRSNAIAGHKVGNVDLYTSGNYATAVEGYYLTLLNKGTPL